MVHSYSVADMTCQSCVRSVTRAVQGVSGVQSVDVSLATGTVTVEAAAEVASETLVAAIGAAGYPNVAPLAEQGTAPAAHITAALVVAADAGMPAAGGCSCCA